MLRINLRASIDSLNSAGSYDPTSDTWSTISSMNTARQFHTATMFSDGKVLIAGGSNGTNSAESFDP